MKRTLLAALIAASFGIAHAATFTVTNLNDAGPGSLRDAVIKANQLPGPDYIEFAVKGEIKLTSGQMQVAGPLTILGPGAGNLVIDANGVGRVFSIFSFDPPCPNLDGPDYLVSISGLTLRNAFLSFAGIGGAIFTEHSLALDQVTIEGSTAAQGAGVGVVLQYPGQSLTVRNSKIAGNLARPVQAGTTAARGGGIYVVDRCTRTAGKVQVDYSVIADNRVRPTSAQGRGGGLYVSSLATDVVVNDTRIFDNVVEVPNPPAPGQTYQGGGITAFAKSLTVTRSEIAGNVIDDVTGADTTRGAGVQLSQDAPDLQSPALAMQARFVNSTISGNRSSATSGGINAYGNVAVEIVNSTMADNVAAPGRTAGVLLSTGVTTPASASNARAPTLKLSSSVLANNAANGADVSSNVATIPSFVIAADQSSIGMLCSTCNMTVNGGGNLIGVDPKLAPLAFNGGPTRTHALLAGSPLVNAGANTLALGTDQRGGGFLRVVNGVADIGAFESSQGAAGGPTQASPLYRFNTGTHYFYTASEAEKDFVLANFPTWVLEGVAYYVFPAKVASSAPVWRFWTGSYHFYTISEAEKNYVLANFPDWILEGMAFQAYPEKTPGTSPVYRFNTGSDHFYTVSEDERTYILANLPWADEGVAYYARVAP